jgi:predicted AAA+ superfamily ATPase
MTTDPTLLFLDEIQESPKAVAHLRYFFEEFPQLHVIAAGSLLEFALKNVPSFPVGRVEQIVLHPLDFDDFCLQREIRMLLLNWIIFRLKTTLMKFN